MIDESTIKAIADLKDAENRTAVIDGKHFSRHELHIVEHDPRPEAVGVRTLSSLVSYLKNNVDELDLKKLVVAIESPQRVAIVGVPEGPSKRRTSYMIANVFKTEFEFKSFMDPESFIIGLQTQFVDDEGRKSVLSLVGNLKAELVQTHADNNNPFMLAPFRTFREISQPASPFILRVRDAAQGQPPRCALFLSDGGQWELQTIADIHAWLETEFEDKHIPVPVIS